MIPNQLFPDYPENERKALLQDNADAVEKIPYVKRFTYDELLQFKEELATVSIDINSIEVKRKEIMAEFKAELTPLVHERSELLTKIHNKAESVEEYCFKMIDQESGEVGFYNDLGELVYRRPILPTEKQTTIFKLPAASNQ